MKNFSRVRHRTAARAAVTAALAAVLGGCAESFNRDPADICQFLADRGNWFESLEQASTRWKVSESLILAFVHHESRFDAEARPPRKRILWVIPGPRRSSAYGYAQAIDGTWNSYVKSTGNRGADRDNFKDAVDFVGWYVDNTTKAVGLPRDDVYGQYLVYHEGARGYKRGSWKKKKWLTEVAKNVQKKSSVYARQLETCTEDHRRARRWYWPFD